MLQQVIPHLPPAHPVYVLFDSWYTSAKLVKWIRQQGWHVIGAVKSNRKRDGQRLTAWHHALKGHCYDRVSLQLANKRRRTCWTRTLLGRIRGVPGLVRVVISQRGPGVRTPKYFLCTDSELRAQGILTRYQQRWSQEVDYWYAKMQLGLGDYRLHSHEAIGKWYAAVYLVLVYWYWQRYEHESRHGRSTSQSEVLAWLRQGYQREVLRAACEEVARGAAVEEVVERYVGARTVSAA